jgi:RNA polymerase sigma-70 factor (ECF subfamily)
VNTLSDEQLLVEHRRGLSGRFELLVRRYSQELFRFAYRLLGSPAAAEDIVQETFLQVHLSMEGFDVSRRFRPWVFTIAANKARDYLRSQKRRPETPLDAAADGSADGGPSFSEFLSGRSTGPDVVLEREERSFRVRQLVEQLPEYLKEVLVLGYYHGFAYKEMADVLDVPIGTIKSRLHSAVSKMGDLISSLEPADDEFANR